MYVSNITSCGKQFFKKSIFSQKRDFFLQKWHTNNFLVKKWNTCAEHSGTLMILKISSLFLKNNNGLGILLDIDYVYYEYVIWNYAIL